MDAVTALYILGAIASVIGVAIALATRQHPPAKLLTWECWQPVPLAGVLPHGADYNLTIQYQAPNTPSVTLPAVYLFFMRLANLGDEPIRSTDLVPADPLRVEIDSGDVLDVSLATATRDVTNFQVQALEKEAKRAASRLTFDFLDSGDGALIRILTTNDEASPYVTGTIVGMPTGPHRTPLTPSGLWTTGMVLTGLFLYGAAIATTVATFLNYVDDAGKLWLLLLPVLALYLPGSVITIVILITAPAVPFPHEIAVPKWAYVGHHRVEMGIGPVLMIRFNWPPNPRSWLTRRHQKSLDPVDD